MKFEFHGISATEENDCRAIRPKEKVRFLPSQDLHCHSKKKQHKHSKHEKKLRSTIKELTTAVSTMQTEIDSLRNYDKDGFRILRRKRVEW